MAKHASTTDRDAKLRALVERQDELIGADESTFAGFCEDVAEGRIDSVPGLIAKLERLTYTGDAFDRDSRIDLLSEAEMRAMEKLTRAERLDRFNARRLTPFQLSLWEARAPQEIPRINGWPVWVAARLVDVVD